jgi:hypothetical protein
MKATVGQVWQDDADILFIIEIVEVGNRLKVSGVGLFDGIKTDYTRCTSADSFQFGRLVFDPTCDSI